MKAVHSKLLSMYTASVICHKQETNSCKNCQLRNMGTAAVYCPKNEIKASKTLHMKLTNMIINAIADHKPAGIEETLLNTWFVAFSSWLLLRDWMNFTPHTKQKP